jgi:dihydroorotase
MKIVIQNGRIVNPANKLDRVSDLYIDGQLIAAIGEAPEGFSADQTIDASGKLVIPGLVDIQCRVREPGYTQKATIASESNAAARGGITSLCIPPDSNPVIDNSAVVELIHHSNQKAGNRCHLYTLGALTKGLLGEQLSNMGTLKAAGCIALSNAQKPFINNLIQRRAMEYAHGQQMLIVIQPYDHALYSNGCAHEGALSTRMGLPPIPEAAETAALAKDIELVVQTGARTHFGQLSCARSVDMIRQAKKDGLPITADVSMHQLFLTDRDIDGFDTAKLTIPPLRDDEDRMALRQGLVDGTIDIICSDHQPHDRDAKLMPFPSAEPGCSTLDTFLPLAFRLVEEGVFDLPTMLQKVTINPARIFQLPVGDLAQGELADVVVVDDKNLYRCSAENFHSAGKNTPFEGWDFNANVIYTLVAGKLIQ